MPIETDTAAASSADLRRLPTSIGGTVAGLLRPRPVDDRLLRSIDDAGFPDGERTVRVRALPQVARTVPAGSNIEGAGWLRTVRTSLTTFVIEHPDATFLVDPSFCRDAERRVLPEFSALLRRVVAPPDDSVATVDGMHTLGVRADFALPTHAHWDHVCGLLDLPGMPVYLRDTERDWILRPGPAPAAGVRAALTDGRELRGYELDGAAVATFSASHDLFGDGSVLLVELAGHTPGSVGVLARTTGGWVLIAGDAAWHHEQIDRVRQKAAFPGNYVDDNRDATFRTLHRLHAARHLMRIVPTHDHDRSHAL